ncbi:MAG: hypothetical protein QXG25_02750 [Nitrososphaerota archaeon]
MPGLDEYRRLIIECLVKEGGQATPDRLLCAYSCLKDLSKRQLMSIVEGMPEVEVVKVVYYPNVDQEIIFLRLKELPNQARDAERGEERCNSPLPAGHPRWSRRYPCSSEPC